MRRELYDFDRRSKLKSSGKAISCKKEIAMIRKKNTDVNCRTPETNTARLPMILFKAVKSVQDQMSKRRKKGINESISTPQTKSTR